jgi:hypothetical protein
VALRFHLDENVAFPVAGGLRSRGLDVSTAAEAGLLSAPDEEHLRHAAAQNRVVFTHDRDFLRLHARGVPHSGIVYAPRPDQSIGDLIRAILFLAERVSAADMRNRVEYV